MGRRYSSDGNQNATADDTILQLLSATTIKPKIYEVIFGCGATPADQSFNMQMGRISDAGTGTAVTPRPLDPGDPASLASAKEDMTVESTYTADLVLLSFSINQQATFRWYVPPEEGLVCPATANNGIGLWFAVVSGGTALCEATFHHEE